MTSGLLVQNDKDVDGNAMRLCVGDSYADDDDDAMMMRLNGWLSVEYVYMCV